MPAVNDVGEPCAGEPQARFDGRALETEQPGRALRFPGRWPKCHHNGLGGNHPADQLPPRQRSTLRHASDGAPG
jgi:hypothetical protein